MEDESSMEGNFSNETFDPYPRDEKLAQIEIGTLACIFLISVFGNGLVLLALYAKKRGRGRKSLPKMYFFIFHLCIADLINAFFNILPQLLWDVTYRFKGGPILCKVVKYGQIFGPYLSSYILMVTALDRYRAICHPLTYHFWSSKRSRVFVAYAWCIAIILSVPQCGAKFFGGHTRHAPIIELLLLRLTRAPLNTKFTFEGCMTILQWEACIFSPTEILEFLGWFNPTFIFSYQEVAPGIWDCWATFLESWGERTYVVWYSVSIFIIPLIGLIFTYTFICRVIWRNAPTDLGKQQQVISRAKINTIKQTIAVIAAYIFCSLPFIVAELWAVWDPSAYEKVWSGPLFTILVLLSSLNSCANPWIFMIFNSDLFMALKMFLRGRMVPSSLCRKSSIGDCSFIAGEARKKTSGCLNLRKMFSSIKCNNNSFNLKRWTPNAEEVGTPTTTEVTTLNFSRE